MRTRRCGAQPTRARKKVDILFVVIGDFRGRRLFGIDLADDRIDQARSEFAANASIYHREAQLESALDQQFFVDHAIEYTPSHLFVDGTSQVAFDAGQNPFIVHTPDRAFATRRHHL